MSLRSFCSGLYRFFTWPFRKIYSCFRREEQEERSPDVFSPEVFSPTEPITSPRTPEAKLSPRVYIRPKRQREKEQELQGKVHFKPLFLPDYFGSSREPKNDTEFKSNTEQARKKQERIKARRAMMKVLEHMEEMDRDDKELFDRQQKSKGKKDVKPTTPKKGKT